MSPVKGALMPIRMTFGLAHPEGAITKPANAMNTKIHNPLRIGNPSLTS
jgi:hypothetical protein